ncbi:MAG: hypothetical protein IT454_23330 [Planctomycetes bacterium]|nr:hypothetical protein [Planctomycetota bacterium]
MHSIHIAAVLLAGISTPALAQWTSSSAANTPVSVQPGDQAVTKAAAAGAGRTWVGWFDQRSGNYDVYVQLLDADGTPLLAPNGLAVSSHPQNSSLIGWDLMADSSGHCVLVFTDIRAGGDLDVYAYRISSSGQFLWGANGVTLSNNVDYDANPVAAELSDGTFVFVWSQGPNGTGTGSVRAQRLDAGGAPLLGANDIALATATTTNEKPSFCEVVGSDNGSFIVQWLRNTASFTSLRHIRVQKYDSNGVAQWNSGAPLNVLDAASVPIAHQPTLISDGSGGAVVGWHRSATLFDCYVQKLSASGAELFPHNGLVVSLEANRHKLDPAFAYLRASGDIVVAFDRREASQGQRGVGAQRISAAGTRLWGADGVELEPIDLVTEGFERIVPFGDGALVTYFQYPTFGGQNSNVLARRLDGNGATLWGPVALSTVASPKDKPQLVIDERGTARMAWDDERNDSGDVFAQNVHVDGALGPILTCTATNYCTAAPNSVGPGATMGWTGSTSLALNNFGLAASGCPANKNALFFYGSTAIAGVPFSAGFKCIGNPVIRLSLSTTDALGFVAQALDLLNPPTPFGQINAGSTWNFQLWYRDPAGTGGATNTTDGLSASFCP